MRGGATFRPGRGASSFHAYPRGKPARIMAAVDVRPGARPPPLATVSDALVVPGRHALYRPDGTRIDLSMPTYLEPDVPRLSWHDAEMRPREAAYFPATAAVPDAPAAIDEPVLFLGTLYKHYGHALTDSLARAWALDHVDPAMKVVFAPTLPAERWPAFLADLLPAVGVPPERVVQAGAALRLRQAILPTPAMQWGRRVYGGFDAPHRRAAARLAPAASPFAGRKVYLSRTRLGEGHRTIRGEAALEARLEREGFAVVYPESLSLAGQVGLFETAACVVGQLGSAFHTVLFRQSERPLPIAQVTGADLDGRFLLVDGLKAVDSHYLDALKHRVPLVERAARALRGGGFRLNEEAFELDVGRTMDLLAGAGFLRG